MSLQAALLSKKAYFFYVAFVVFACAAAGYWQQHRHDAPSVVLRANACLARAASSASSTDSVTCFTDEIIHILDEQGLTAAFSTFKIFYTDEPLFRGITCHNAAHILGAAAYNLYVVDHEVFNAPEASYCGYGFYHGFMEKMLVTEGPGQYAATRTYCASLGVSADVSIARAACDHGIGHALFDSLPASLYGNPKSMVAQALGSCEDILPDQEATADRIRCSKGVFHALTVAFSGKRFGLAFTGTAAFSVCKAPRLEYQPGCYSQVGVGLIRNNYMTRTAALTLIDSIEGSKNQTGMLIEYAMDEVNRDVATGNFPALYSLCKTVPANQESSCVRGAMVGIRLGGSMPGQEYAEGFTFCKNGVTEKERADCYQQAITLGTLASDKAVFVRACHALPEAYAKQCGV